MGVSHRDYKQGATDLIDLVYGVWVTGEAQSFANRAIVFKSESSVIFVSNDQTLWQWDVNGGITEYYAPDELKKIVQDSWDMMVDSKVFL